MTLPSSWSLTTFPIPRSPRPMAGWWASSGEKMLPTRKPLDCEEAMHDMRLTPDALTWRDHPNIPKGGQVTILIGDPTKTGEVVVQRLKLPPNYHVPPHIHPYTEYDGDQREFRGWRGRTARKDGRTVEARLILDAPGEASALWLDGRRRSHRPDSLHRTRRHRVRPPGRRPTQEELKPRRRH